MYTNETNPSKIAKHSDEYFANITTKKGKITIIINPKIP